MKIYTGGGDRGRTSLFSGERMSKGHARIAAYGEVDELNSVLGAIRAALPDALESLAQEICRIQSDLFDVGAWLATSTDAASRKRLRPVTEEWAAFLEGAMDRMDAELPELRTFVLPGGAYGRSLGPCGTNRLPPLRAACGRPCRVCRRPG